VTGALWAEAPQPDSSRDYLIADVFTGTPLEGNQLGVFLDARGMTTELMQRTTRELNLSETVFFLPADNSKTDVRVRIFTPASELPFAGHPTLGAGFVLAERLGKRDITLQTGIGPIPLTFADDGYGQMEQPVPKFDLYERTEELLDALHLKGSELPIEAYRNGPRHVYVALPDLAAVAGLEPDFAKLKEHAVGVNCFAGDGTSWKTRVFVPSLGVNEDPATGSAAGPLGVHLVRHGRIGFGQRIEVSQGAEIGRPSTLYVQIDGSEGNIEHVYVGGYAVIVASGQYRLS
jgi:trans-2,3-dihydro-3-hydroxyanthranilate isomerase